MPEPEQEIHRFRGNMEVREREGETACDVLLDDWLLCTCVCRADAEAVCDLITFLHAVNLHLNAIIEMRTLDESAEMAIVG